MNQLLVHQCVRLTSPQRLENRESNDIATNRLANVTRVLILQETKLAKPVRKIGHAKISTPNGFLFNN